MQKGLDPTKTTTCMKCRKVPSRYHGTWGEEGLCRACILGMEPAVRRKVQRELHPAERKRWQLDDLAERAREKERRLRAEVDPGEDRAPEEPGGPGGAVARRYTEPYRHRPPPEEEPRRDRDRHDRRSYPRVFAELAVQFTVAAGTERTSSPLHGRSFRSVSRDLSAGGLRIQIRDPALFELPSGCPLRLEIPLSTDGARLHASGVVQNIVRTGQERDAGYLCVRFDSLSRGNAAALEQYLTRGRPARPA